MHDDASRRLPQGAGTPSCLHCALERAVADERVAAGPEIRVRGADPHPLPIPFRAETVYRACRALLQDARRAADAAALVVSLYAIAGKTHADVLVTVHGARGTRLLRRSFPRYRSRALAAGFSEALTRDEAVRRIVTRRHPSAMMGAMSDLPPCGLYRTGAALGDHVPAGRLVYFHDHGDPGPGVYLPHTWVTNRARWHERGHTIPSAAWAATLVPLQPEGLYRICEAFACCERRCREFAPDLLVQLGYDGAARPLLFVPAWTEQGLALPEIGTVVDESRLCLLARLTVEAAAGVTGDAVH